MWDIAYWAPDRWLALVNAICRDASSATKQHQKKNRNEVTFHFLQIRLGRVDDKFQ